MDGLVCNIVRDFLRVMLHFATESEWRDTTHVQQKTGLRKVAIIEPIRICMQNRG